MGKCPFYRNILRFALSLPPLCPIRPLPHPFTCPSPLLPMPFGCCRLPLTRTPPRHFTTFVYYGYISNPLTIAEDDDAPPDDQKVEDGDSPPQEQKVDDRSALDPFLRFLFKSRHTITIKRPVALVSKLHIRKETQCCAAKSVGYDFIGHQEGAWRMPSL